jgi:hypothetical protein
MKIDGITMHGLQNKSWNNECFALNGESYSLVVLRDKHNGVYGDIPISGVSTSAT